MPIILRYVTQAWLKIVSFLKTIFKAKSSDGKVEGKLLKGGSEIAGHFGNFYLKFQQDGIRGFV